MTPASFVEEDRDFITRTSAEAFTRERVLGGHCRVLGAVDQANLREEIARHFSVHTNQVIVVGSSKLGYSLSPQKCFRAFGDQSDIDVAIVGNRLFEDYWFEMYKAKQALVDWPEMKDARKYLFRGWIRPDKLPLVDLRNDWFDFFNDLQARRVGGPYAVRAGLYLNANFLEEYHLNGVRLAFGEI